MNSEVSGGQTEKERERETERESREATFIHMVVVRRLPLRTLWSGRNFTFHSLRAFFKTLLPTTERSVSVICI